MNSIKRIFACLMSAALVLCGLSGCVYSDTITQVIYDQNPENELADTDDLLYVEDPNSSQTSDQLPQTQTDPNTDNQDQQNANAPQYGEGDSSSTTSEQERGLKGDDNAAPLDSDSQGQYSGGEAAEEEPEEGEDSGDSNDDNSKNDSNDNGSTGAGKNKKSTAKVYTDYGEFPEYPEGIKKVAAVGNGAILVSMLGGSEDKTPLVAADSDFVKNPEIQKVLKKKGVSNVKSIWKNDGSSKGDLDSKGLKSLIELKPDLCFCFEGSKTFTEKQMDELVDAGIGVYTLPSFNKASEILSAVDIVSKILDKGGNSNAAVMAKEYRNFHDKLVDELKSLNGGIAGGFDFDRGKKVGNSPENTKYTVLISDWDKTASYNFANLNSSEGVGVADAGYKSSPFSYYMSIGGVVNNAAAGKWDSVSAGRAIVWQFSQSQASSNWAYWSSIDRSKASFNTVASDGSDWTMLYNKQAEVGLGSDKFPMVLVSKKEMVGYIRKNAQRLNGIYHPFSRNTLSGGVVQQPYIGFYNGSNFVRAYIGENGSDESALYNADGQYRSFEIGTNPSGLFSSWTEGSLESVLEAPFVYSTFHDGSYNYLEKVLEFYETVYEYRLTESELSSFLPDA